MKKFLLFACLVLISVSIHAQGRMGKLRADYDSLGNYTGKYLFPKENGANLRILDINVWDFVRDYAWFTVKLTDHYPNYADILLK